MRRFGAPGPEAAGETTRGSKAGGKAGDKAARHAAWGRGRRAERLAAWWLRLKGYRIIARDLRTPVGEIDLIARRGRVLAIVEVKTRGDLDQAGQALALRQQARIERAAAAFLQRQPALARLDLRFDVVLVAPGRRPRHLAGAWRCGEPRR